MFHTSLVVVQLLSVPFVSEQFHFHFSVSTHLLAMECGGVVARSPDHFEGIALSVAILKMPEEDVRMGPGPNWRERAGCGGAKYTREKREELPC